jgi:hypothetical protein
MRLQFLALTIEDVQILCAGCGCSVDAGVRVTVCSDESCCCRQLPIQDQIPESVAKPEE